MDFEIEFMFVQKVMKSPLFIKEDLKHVLTVVERPDIMATKNNNGVSKRSEWTSKLVDPYAEGLLKRTKNKIFPPDRKKGPYSKSRWKQLIGTSRYDNEGGKRYINKLEEWDALIDKGLKDGNGKPHRVYVLDEKKLVKAFHNSAFYRVNRDLFLKAVDQEEPRLKVVQDR